MRYSLYKFLASQLARPPPLLHHAYDLSHRTVVVTGANTGLGYEAAKHFARMRPGKVVLACRNMEKGQRAAERIRHETGFDRVDVHLLDQASFASVQSFAMDFKEREERLDILVANAGVARDVYEPTEDGWEVTLQTNHLSPSLLSLLLLPKLLSTARLHPTKPRLSIVSSETHYFGRFPESSVNSENMLETLGGEEYCRSTPLAMYARYMETKLLNVFFARALASHVSSPSHSTRNHTTAPNSPQVIINSVNPGLCVSSINASVTNPVVSYLNRLVEPLLARSTEVGGRALVWGALGLPRFGDEGGLERKAVVGGVHEEDDATHGGYVDGWKLEEVSDCVLQNRELERRIWRETVEILARVSSTGLRELYLVE